MQFNHDTANPTIILLLNTMNTLTLIYPEVFRRLFRTRPKTPLVSTRNFINRCICGSTSCSCHSLSEYQHERDDLINQIHSSYCCATHLTKFYTCWYSSVSSVWQSMAPLLLYVAYRILRPQNLTI